MSVLFGVSKALIMIINTSFSGMNCYKKHLTSSLYRTAGFAVVRRLVTSLYYTMLYLVGFTSLDACTVRRAEGCSPTRTFQLVMKLRLSLRDGM